MTRPRLTLAARAALLLLGSALVPVPGGIGRAVADEPPPPPRSPVPPSPGSPSSPAAPGAPPVAPPPLTPISDADAAPLLDGLKKALKLRTSGEAQPALDALAGKSHKDFEAALSRLLVHPSVEVAAMAARCLGERAGPKTPATLWRAWMLPVNDKRWVVKAALLDALAATKAPLDARAYDEVESVWRQVPNTETMIAVARYFTVVKTDKRPCKMLAFWLDEPRAGSVSDASNPPASYWEARWKTWAAVKPAVVDALQAITGQHFDSSEEAKAWFKKNPKFGVDW